MCIYIYNPKKLYVCGHKWGVPTIPKPPKTYISNVSSQITMFKHRKAVTWECMRGENRKSCLVSTYGKNNKSWSQ